MIGAGNLAWHLAFALETEAGVAIEQVYSRNIANAQKLAKRLYDAKATDQLDFSKSQSSLFLIAVPDALIGTIAHSLQLPPKARVIHTSGTETLDVLKDVAEEIGVFYPLQTFSQEKEVDFSQIPFFIEANTTSLADLLVKIAGHLSKEVYEMNSEERKRLHLAAVFACNFTNHLLTIAHQELKKLNLPFEVLHPLIVETINKALEITPFAAQTGPALRGDQNTINTHLQLLAEQPLIQHIYRLLSENIQTTYCFPARKSEQAANNG